MKTNFIEMVERAARPSNPNLEEEHRKSEFPKTCSEDCKHHQCPYHNTDHYGQACEMQWQPKKTAPQLLPHTAPKTAYSKPYNLTKEVEKALDKVFKPLTDRIEALENQEKQAAIERSFTFNGKRTRIDIGMNQERIANA